MPLKDSQKINNLIAQFNSSYSPWLNSFFKLVQSNIDVDYIFVSFRIENECQVIAYPGINDKLNYHFDQSIEQYALDSKQIFELSDLDSYSQFKSNPLLAYPYNGKYFAGWPLDVKDVGSVGVMFVLKKNNQPLNDNEKDKLVFFRSILEDKITLSDVEVREKISHVNIQEIEKLKNNFLSSISHEIRTPLSAIIGLSNILDTEENISQVDFKHHVNTLKDSSNQLLFLVNQVLDYNLLESGQVKMDKLPFRLSSICDTVQKTLTSKAIEKRISLIIRLNKDVPKNLIGDEHKLEQILLYLCDNAIKHTDKGKVELNISLENISGKKCVINFKVSDTGYGIPSKDIPNLFSAFNKVNISINEYIEEGGTGLGLAITKKLVQTLGSDIELKTISGEGSTFSFSLNFDIASLNEISQVQVPKINKKLPLENKKILLVEDNTVNAMIFKKFLNKWGAEVKHAENGKLATEIVAEQPDEFHMVLMDIQMPIMNGLDASRIIRKNISSEKLPIIAVTASILQDSLTISTEAGMNDCITKPFVPDELLAKMTRLLSD